MLTRKGPGRHRQAGRAAAAAAARRSGRVPVSLADDQLPGITGVTTRHGEQHTLAQAPASTDAPAEL